tara:strand:+ start:1407 stop:1670 length:264 start_codon:yes stop_codon:yes gene_type:complete
MPVHEEDTALLQVGDNLVDCIPEASYLTIMKSAGVCHKLREENSQMQDMMDIYSESMTLMTVKFKKLELQHAIVKSRLQRVSSLRRK